MSAARVLRAGSAALGVSVVLACVGELPAPPAAPTVVAPELVHRAELTLRGLKPASTAIHLLDGTVLVPLDERTSWTADVVLQDGTNAFRLMAVDALERESPTVAATVVLDDDPPNAPEVDPVPPTTLRDEVTLSGTKDSGDRIAINGSVRPTGSTDNSAFSIDVALALGPNVLRVATLDQAGNESEVVEVRVERAETVPFSVQTPATPVASGALTLLGTRGAGVEVLLGDAVIVPASASSGPWSHDVTLTAGANALNLQGRIALEPESFLSARVDVFYDDTPPTLALSSPGAGDWIASNDLALTGTVDDATAVSVEVCAGSCTSNADFSAASVNAGVFTAALDLSGRSDLDDGAMMDVVVRATDAVLRRTVVSTTVLLGRAPVSMAGADAVDLASAGLYQEARAYVDAAGAAQVQLDLDGPPWQADPARISDIAAVSASAPQLILIPGGAAAVVLEDSPSASLTAGEPGLVYAEVTPAGATRAVVVQGDLGSAVTSADLALGTSGTLIAYSQGDEVSLVAESAGGLAFDAPVLISDATTLAPSGVRLAPLSASRVVVIWSETSDRDGTADDADIVACVVDEAGAPVGAPFLVSSGTGDSTAPSLAPVDADTVLLGWLQDGAVRGASAELAGLIAGAAVTSQVISAATGAGTASAFSLATSGARVAVCWLDDGPALVGAASPGLVVRTSSGGLAGLGTAVVQSNGSVAAAACALSGDVLHQTWIVGGTMFLQPRVIP